MDNLIAISALTPEQRSQVARATLEALPEWFGIAAAREDYIAEVAALEVFVASVAGDSVGFASLKPHTAAAAELHLIAVLRPWHGQGVGRALLQRVEDQARLLGHRFLTVKTLAPSVEDAAYSATRAFYLRQGFQPLEVFPTLWGQENPCLLLLKAL